MGRSGAATPCCATCGAVLRRTRRAAPRLLWRAGWIWGGMGWGGMGREVGRGGRGEGRVMEGGKWRDGGGMGEGWVRGRRWDGRRGSYAAHLESTRRRCRRGWTPKRGALWVERGWTPLPCPKGMRNPGTRETHQLRHAVGGAAQMRCGQRRSYGWCIAADVECVQRRGNSR